MRGEDDAVDGVDQRVIRGALGRRGQRKDVRGVGDVLAAGSGERDRGRELGSRTRLGYRGGSDGEAVRHLRCRHAQPLADEGERNRREFWGDRSQCGWRDFIEFRTCEGPWELKRCGRRARRLRIRIATTRGEEGRGRGVRRDLEHV
ncbi:unnamed protein product [Mycena citricolor]|uniref:Uncharacterized protein n=1 Tax=Mycena citricolor TaxID=2018698 RepID=A0AAD2HMF2_9AGAR|nr:unnamed protein product [Mycena citricolor]